MRLSLLDRSRTRAGRPDAEGVVGTLARARWAENLGYERFWVAEHHAVPGIASGAPTVLLAAIGAVTTRIRIGTGGVMLPNHQPLVVAEQALVLEALYPGRVDLGVGRSLGFTAPVREALRHDAEAADTFERDVAELRAHLDGTSAVTARPAAATRVPLFVLATGRGLAVAARAGLPAVVGGPILADAGLEDALASYRREFRPSERAEHPSVVVSLDVTVADDDATARELALPEAWAMARSRETGEFPPLASPREIRSMVLSPQTASRIDGALARAVAGSPSTVRRRLDELAERTRADELLASTSTDDRDALRASDAMLREIIAG